MRRAGFPRLHEPPSLDAIRREWADDLRITVGTDPGTVVIAVCGETERWVEIELGTGDVEHLIRMLNAAHDEAQNALDAVGDVAHSDR